MMAQSVKIKKDRNKPWEHLIYIIIKNDLIFNDYVKVQWFKLQVIIYRFHLKFINDYMRE